MRYAIIESNTVVNVAEASDALGSNWVQSDTAAIGWTYSGGNFTAPSAPDPAPSAVAPWSKKDFLLKFTPTEYAAIKAATLVNSDLDYYWTLFNVAGDVMKDDPSTIAGVNLLEQVKLIAVGRAAEILA